MPAPRSRTLRTGYSTTQRAVVPAELRDPRGATMAITWATPGRPMMPSWDAQRAIDQGYRASWLVARAINIVADTISSLPFRAGADMDNESDFNPDAPLAQLLGPPPGNPNPESSAREMWRNAVINYLVTGRFAWEIDANAPNDIGVELWPLKMSILDPIPDTGGRRYFSGFQYTPAGELNKIIFDRDEVVYGYRKSPDDPRQAESILMPLALNVSVLVQIDQYTYAFMANDAKPATMVIHAPMASEDARRAFQRQWMSEYRGPQNANKTGFVEIEPNDDGSVSGGVEIQQVGATNRDSQVIQIYEQQQQAVSSGLGVPMSLLDASGRTFDNAGQEYRNYLELTIKPLCADMQDIINRELAPKLGSEVGWFDLSKIPALRPQLVQGVNFADVKDDMLRNERRMFAGLDPVDEQELLDEKQKAIELQQQAFAQNPATPGNANEPSKSDPAAQADQQKQLPSGSAAGSAAGAAQPRRLKAVRDDGDGPVDQAETRHPGKDGHVHVKGGHHPRGSLDDVLEKARQAALVRVTRLLGDQLAGLDGRMERAVVSRAEGKRGQQMVERSEVRAEGVFDAGFWLAEARAAVRPVFSAIATTVEAVLGDSSRQDVDMTEWVDSHADELAQGLIEFQTRSLSRLDTLAPSTVDELRAACVQALDDGRIPASSCIVDDAWRDAVRSLTEVRAETVRSLLTRMVAGEIDLDQALNELEMS